MLVLKIRCELIQVPRVVTGMAYVMREQERRRRYVIGIVGVQYPCLPMAERHVISTIYVILRRRLKHVHSTAIEGLDEDCVTQTVSVKLKSQIVVPIVNES